VLISFTLFCIHPTCTYTYIFPHSTLHSKLSESQSFKDQLKTCKELFRQLDKNKDGMVDANEFTSLMRDASGRPSWLFKAAALSDQT
jgi:EF hand